MKVLPSKLHTPSLPGTACSRQRVVVRHSLRPGHGQGAPKPTQFPQFGGVRPDVPSVPHAAAQTISGVLQKDQHLQEGIISTDYEEAHFMRGRVEEPVGRVEYCTQSYEAIDVSSMQSVEEKIRVIAGCIRLQVTQPFDLFQGGPFLGPYKAHAKILDETLKLMINPRATTLVLLDRRTKFVAGFAVLFFEAGKHSGKTARVELATASCGHMFKLILRAIDAHAAGRAAGEVLVLTDDDAVHERHALLSHGLSVAPGYDVSDPPSLPLTPWAGCWED